MASDDEPDASEQPSECSPAPFPFLALPVELQALVMTSLPNLRMVISLSLTCKAANAIYRSNEKKVLTAMRNRITAPIFDFYAFLTTLHIEPSAVVEPPAAGWPNLVATSATSWGRSELVMDVVRNLPYIKTDGGYDNLNNVDYNSYVVDRSTLEADSANPTSWEEDDVLEADGKGWRKEDTIFLTDGYDTGAVTLALNVKFGDIRPYVGIMDTEDDEAVASYFAKRKRELSEGYQVFVPDMYPLFRPDDTDVEDEIVHEDGEPSFPGTFFGADRDYFWVWHLYRTHGWPSPDWRKVEGLKQIREFAQRRDAEC